MAQLATISKTKWFSKVIWVTHWEKLLYMTRAPSYGVKHPPPPISVCCSGTIWNVVVDLK